MGVAGGALVGPLLAGILMAKYGPWVPIYVTLFAIPPILIILMMIPETLVKKQKADGAKLGMRDHIANGIKEFSSAFQILKKVDICLVLVVFFFLNPRAAAQSSTLTQYISKHFGWTLAQTSILLSPLSIVEMLVLGLLPKLSDVLTSPRFGFTNFRRDLFLTRVSMLLLAVAILIQGISTNIVIFLFALFVAQLGSAVNPLARATVSHFVDPAYTSRLYALIGMVEVLGSFTGGPVLAWFFSKGLELKGIFTGLPWFYVSFLCFLTFTALLFVKPPPPGKSSEDGILSDDDEIRPDNPVRLD
jgi:MFS transporter, PCFT/HCP family, solute carrier family 46 (folate transporter), member 1